MPLSLLNHSHSALALFAQSTRIPTSARSIGFLLQKIPAFFSGISIGIICKFDSSVWVVVLGFFCITSVPFGLVIVLVRVLFSQNNLLLPREHTPVELKSI
jgi:hypothetical protein